MRNKNNWVDRNKNEEDFQRFYDGWSGDGNKRDWDGMLNCVFWACRNLCKKIYKTRGVPYDEDAAVEAFAYFTEHVLKKGKRPDRLSSYCWFYCIKAVNENGLSNNDRKLKLILDGLDKNLILRENDPLMEIVDEL